MPVVIRWMELFSWIYRAMENVPLRKYLMKQMEKIRESAFVTAIKVISKTQLYSKLKTKNWNATII